MSPKSGKDTRRRLVREGLAAFFERGYHGSGVQHIVDAAGIPKGSFYNHFRSKEELAIESVESYAAAVERRLSRIFESAREKSALETLDELLRELIGLQESSAERRGCLLANLAAEVALTSPAVRDATRTCFESWRGPLAQLIEQGQTEGSIRNDLPPGELADFFLDLWEGALLRMKMEGGSTRPLEERRRQLTSQFLPPQQTGPRRTPS